VQHGHRERAEKSDDHAAERNFIRNDEVFQIDERRDDQTGHYDAIHQRECVRLPTVE